MFYFCLALIPVGMIGLGWLLQGRSFGVLDPRAPHDGEDAQ